MRAKLGKAPLVEKPNPLGETLELLLGAAAAALTAWQQAVVAAVFELCLVGVMVIFELLGQNAGGRAAIQDKADPADRQPDREPILAKAGAKASASPAGRSRPKPAPALPSVKAFIAERVSPAEGERVEMKALVQEYRAWCAGKGSGPVDLESFLEEVERVCRKIGIEIVSDAQRVFCLNVRIEATESAQRQPALASAPGPVFLLAPRPSGRGLHFAQEPKHELSRSRRSEWPAQLELFPRPESRATLGLFAPIAPKVT